MRIMSTAEDQGIDPGPDQRLQIFARHFFGLVRLDEPAFDQRDEERTGDRVDLGILFKFRDRVLESARIDRADGRDHADLTVPGGARPALRAPGPIIATIGREYFSFRTG